MDILFQKVMDSKGIFLIRSSKQLTIRDSSQNNTGKIISYKKIAIHIAGSLVLESGTIEEMVPKLLLFLVMLH